MIGGSPTGLEKAAIVILVLFVILLFGLLILCWVSAIGALAWCLVHPVVFLLVIPFLYFCWRAR